MESDEKYELHRVSQGMRGETSTDLLDAYCTEAEAILAARRILCADPGAWLSIVHVDADGLAEPVVAQVEFS